MTHLKNLEKVVGNLRDKQILDVGSGRGEFLLDCAQHGYDATGLEVNPDKISRARQAAEKQGVSLKIVSGYGEKMPFPDSSFDFANVGEVIEHVSDPIAVLAEIKRVLRSGGSAYVSVHNRYGFYDTHFHVYFLGWMPRFLANFYLFLLRKHKDYLTAVDLQNIKGMHYYTCDGFSKIAERLGFNVIDTREIKLNHKFSGILSGMVVWIYKNILRLFYVSTFHLLLTKTK